MRFCVALCCLLPCTAAFDVVGWYVGDNLTDWPMDTLNWEVYSTIRLGRIVVSPNGTALGCSQDKTFVEALRLARLHGKTLTLGATFGHCTWKDTNATTIQYCQNYLKTLGPAVRSCGPNIAGLEFDHEGDDETGPFHIPAKYWGRAGIVSKEEATWFTRLMDDMQKSMGGSYTVSEDIGVWGFGGFDDGGDEYPFNLLTPWVDVEIMKANPNLFVNTMSYHWTKDCSIKPWKRDAHVVHELWGIPKSQINLGIGFYSYNHTGVPGELPWQNHGEPTWHSLSKLCPDVPEGVCECHGIYFVSKQECMQVGQLVKEEGFRGVFPWAANYDSPDRRDSLIHYVGLGLGLVNNTVLSEEIRMQPTPNSALAAPQPCTAALGSCTKDSACCTGICLILNSSRPGYCQDSQCPNQQCPQSDACKPPAIKWVCPTLNKTVYYPSSKACSEACALEPWDDCCYPVNQHSNTTQGNVCSAIPDGPYKGKQCTPDNLLGPGGGGIHGEGYECRNGGEFRCQVIVPECHNDCDLCKFDCKCDKYENVVKIC